MELGSAGSSSNSSSSSSSDSLNGLKFGKKIYFENANGPGGGGGSSASVSASGGRPPPAPAKKGKGGVGAGGEPPRCQVEGCKLDLSGAKAYYSRHKVCGMHSKSPKVVVAGLEQRFCQQCSRFHLLPEFDQGKRSCRRRLAGHNERRRKPPPPGNLLSARFGNLSSPFLAQNNGRSGSFLLDFSKYPAHTGPDPWPNTRSSVRQLDYQQQQTTMWQHPNTDTSSPSEIQDQGSTATRANYSEIPSGEECYNNNGFSASSSRALSLLSNQPSGSRDLRFSSFGINNGYVNGATTTNPMAHQSSSHCDSIEGFSSHSSLWGFKGSSECNSSSSHEMAHDLGLGHHQISQPGTASCQYSEDLDMAQQIERDFLVLQHSRGYDSSLHDMHWSL